MRPSVSAPPWCAAVFTSRERADVVLQAVQAIHRAATQPTLVDVMVNGNRALADELCRVLAQQPHAPALAPLRVWSIALGDKAHAWNEYVHGVWPGARQTFFVDGYARVAPDALGLLAAALRQRPEALAASGVPSVGRSARGLRLQMLRDGGLHGNLFALPEHGMSLLRSRNFRLPVGLYRTDATIGAALSFGMDPQRHPWSPKTFLAVVGEATWSVPATPWWRPAVLAAQLKRRRRQAQGDLENRAVSHFLATLRQPPESLPPTAAQLVEEWAVQRPEELDRLLHRSILRRQALRALAAAPSISAQDSAPQLVWGGSAL